MLRGITELSCRNVHGAALGPDCVGAMLSLTEEILVLTENIASDCTNIN